MANPTIDLECPNCDSLLELDAGFAGGVCRCAQCGILMTVPASDAEAPERLERPDAPTDRPDRPAQPATDDASSPGDTEQVYRTASGRTVTVQEISRVPMAPLKRKAVRAATVAVFLVVVGGLLTLCGLAAYQLVTQPSAAQVVAATYVETFSYDRRANPLDIEAPNFFGLPLANRVAVIYDTTGLDATQRDAVNTLLLDGLQRTAPAVKVSLYLALTDGRVQRQLDRLTLGGGDMSDVSERLRQLDTSADPNSMLNAVEQALDREPDVLILVTARDVDDREADVLANMIDPQATRVDAVLIDADSFGLEDVTKSTNGHFVPLSSEYELAEWLDADRE